MAVGNILQPFKPNPVKKLSHLSILSFFLLYLSCTSEKPKSLFDFPANNLPEFKLKSEKQYFQEVINPMHVKQKGDYLVLMEIYRIPPEKPLIHLIKKNNLSYYSAKGATGFGPNEIANAELFDPGFDENTFWIYSSRSKRMAEFSLQDTNRLSISEFRQPEDMYMIYNMFYTKDTTFIGISANDPHKLIEVDSKGKWIQIS